MDKLYPNDLYPWAWSSVVDYVISNIPLYNKLIDFNIFNDHEPESDHRPLIITLNIFMHNDPNEEN